jgi:acyl-CoA thioester hydrolase
MDRVSVPHRGSLADVRPSGPPIAAPLRLHGATVHSGWVDYNGHLSEWAYLLVFGDGADAFFRYVGVDDSYRASGRSLYTAETHLRHLREVKLGQRVALTLQVLAVDSKRLHLLHQMLATDASCVATAEQLLLHVDSRAGRVVEFGEQLAGRLQQIAAAHAELAMPGYVGQVIRVSGRRR